MGISHGAKSTLNIVGILVLRIETVVLGIETLVLGNRDIGAGE